LGGEKLKPSRPYTGVLFTALFLFFVIFTLPLSAQDAEPLPERVVVDETTIILGEAPDVTATSGGASIFIVIRMVLVLALCALAIYGVFFFIKRLSRPQEIRDPHLKVLARAPLSSDTFAAVISIGTKAWLVAGGSGNISLISEVSDTESLETMLLDDANRSAENFKRFDFGSLLRRFGASHEKKGQSGNSHMDILRKQQERLKRL